MYFWILQEYDDLSMLWGNGLVHVHTDSIVELYMYAVVVVVLLTETKAISYQL